MHEIKKQTIIYQNKLANKIVIKSQQGQESDQGFVLNVKKFTDLFIFNPVLNWPVMVLSIEKGCPDEKKCMAVKRQS